MTLKMCLRVKLALASVTNKLLTRARNAITVPATVLVINQRTPPVTRHVANATGKLRALQASLGTQRASLGSFATLAPDSLDVARRAQRSWRCRGYDGGAPWNTFKIKVWSY